MSVVFTPAEEAPNARMVVLYVWAIHSAAEDISDERVQSQSERARTMLVKLHANECVQGVLFKGIILRSKFSGETGDLRPAGRPGRVEVQGLCSPCDPDEWKKENGLLKLLSIYSRDCAVECFTDG